MSADPTARTHEPHWLDVMLCAAMAGALGWGIRGQYGHETGAMVAGVLVSLVLCLKFCPTAPLLSVGRAVAWGTIAIGFGGSMTYGQTIGLTQNAPVLGNWAALGWGMLGLAVKGGLWIGFAGAFLGLGLGGVRYRAWEMAFLMLGMIPLSMLGVWLFNEPFEPAQQSLPRIYFSADWYWQPGEDVDPRREVWGGLLLALCALLLYVRTARRDQLAFRLGLWGVLGGAIGFPLGQCVQAAHAWNIQHFQAGLLARMDPYINWWNFMETTFGATMGAALGLGLWLNRRLIRISAVASTVTMAAALEFLLIAVHVTLLLCGEFGLIRSLGWVYGFGLMLGLLPVVGVAGGRWWPFFVTFPIVAIPIAGKTVRNLALENNVIDPALGTIAYVIVPLLIGTIMAVYFARQAARAVPAASFLRWGLAVNVLLFYCLNFAFFRYPWPLGEWTMRTPNALVFAICAAGLLLAAGRAPDTESASSF